MALGSTRTAVVTGGAGFIGSHLSLELANRGYRVIIVDNLSSGRQQNVDRLLEEGNATFLRGDICDFPFIEHAFEGADYVFHHAAIASVPDSVQHPLTSHEVNATGTLKVLLAAKKAGVKKVVNASSSAIYGNAPVLPIGEGTRPDPKSPYAVTKLMGEQYCSIFQEIYGLPTASLRYFNVYGPGQQVNSSYAAVIPNFIEASIEGRVPVIFGNGLQTRDFVFVKDVVSANVAAMEGDITGVLNVGMGTAVTVLELARAISALTGSGADPKHEKTRDGDIVHSVSDIQRAKAAGWQPRWDLRSGLAETIGWFREKAISPATPSRTG